MFTYIFVYWGLVGGCAYLIRSILELSHLVAMIIDKKELLLDEEEKQYIYQEVTEGKHDVQYVVNKILNKRLGSSEWKSAQLRIDEGKVYYWKNYTF